MIRPEIHANLTGVEDPETIAHYTTYLEAVFRDDHAQWLEATFRKHGRTQRFSAKCIRRFARWLVAMRAYVARQQQFHYGIDHLSVILYVQGSSQPLARIEVTERRGITFSEE